MRVYNYAAPQDSTNEDEVEPSAITTAQAASQTSVGILPSEDNTSNGWVDSLLRQSSTETFSIGPAKLEAARRLVHYNGRSAHFSPIDFALILILARQKNRIISYSRIYRRLWGPTSKVSVPRLRVHIFRARKRLDDELMHGIRIINRGGGYLLEFAGQAQDHSLRRKEFESGLDTSRTMRILHSPPMNDQEEVSIAAE